MTAERTKVAALIFVALLTASCVADEAPITANSTSAVEESSQSATTASPTDTTVPVADTTVPVADTTVPVADTTVPVADTPRLIAYYNAATDPPLAGLSESQYTHVILSFLVPDDNGSVEPSDALASALSARPAIQNAQAAGKTVMVSLGGGEVTADDWLAWGNNADNVAGDIAAIVNEHGLDGVDLDVEGLPYTDQGTFAAYGDAVIALTNAIASALPSTVISHAPQPPYLCEPGSMECPNDSLYAYILAGTGGQIDWLNMQYYSNPPLTTSDVDEVASYQSIISGWDGFPGLSPGQLVVGKPYSSKVSGYEQLESVTDNILEPLVQMYGQDMGGFMAWEYSEDEDERWSKTVATTLDSGGG